MKIFTFVTLLLFIYLSTACKVEPFLIFTKMLLSSLEAKMIEDATVQDLLDAGVVSKDWVERRKRQIKGQLNFRRCVEVLEKHKPWWYLGQRPATDFEDRYQRIDMWINHCQMGWVPVQVKSSLHGMRRHWLKERKNSNLRKIPVVVSNDELTEEEIVANFEKAAFFERSKGDFRKRLRRIRKGRL